MAYKDIFKTKQAIPEAKPAGKPAQTDGAVSPTPQIKPASAPKN